MVTTSFVGTERRSSIEFGIEATLRAALAVLCDIDGVLTIGGRLTAGAAAFGHAVGERLILVSNNSTETPAEMACRLAALGLGLPPDHIVLAGWETICVAAAIYGGARALVLGTRSLRDHAAAQGLRPVTDDSAEIVILCRDLELSYDRMATAFDLVSRGCPLMVANPDVWHPGPDGARIMETGALLGTLATAGAPDPPRIIGKPHGLLFEIALARIGCRADQAVMIGDNDTTDIEGARRAGINPIKIGECGDARTLEEMLGGLTPGQFDPLAGLGDLATS